MPSVQDLIARASTKDVIIGDLGLRLTRPRHSRVSVMAARSIADAAWAARLRAVEESGGTPPPNVPVPASIEERLAAEDQLAAECISHGSSDGGATWAPLTVTAEETSTWCGDLRLSVQAGIRELLEGDREASVARLASFRVA